MSRKRVSAAKRKAKRPAIVKRLKTRLTGWRAVAKRLALIVAILMILPVPVILLCAVVQPPVTSVMLQHIVARTVNGERPIWPGHTTVSRNKLSPYLRRAVLASEDDRFYLHFGIDTVEINRAIERRRRGGKLRGASTLTQQVAKNLFLWNGRSFVRKGIEAYIALLLELFLTKERILDLYLNLAEWGPNAFGAEAAARLHFNKSAANLTRDEAARLAAILPAPRRWSPKGSIATRRAATILVRMQYAAPKSESASPAKIRRSR